ncbi:hypothetical protein EKO27_g9455 [Xylaria grammica]|uniref:Protein kinase domain-containing protein n=1 Tax=Xylaria grammica TaxID=363999 RepID=A0A439CU08_9PEZI|nr:hypothetical protein EKO27_g9455 [Xylaria grammica]
MSGEGGAVEAGDVEAGGVEAGGGEAGGVQAGGVQAGGVQAGGVQAGPEYRRRGINTYGDGFSLPDLGGDPNPRSSPIRYFDARRRPFQRYKISEANLGGGITLTQNPRLTEESFYAQKQFRRLVDYFGAPRLVPQRVLGYGGHGMAAHFKDRGDASQNQPPRDLAVKVSLYGRRDDGLVREKQMMRKVKGSAHCIQLIESQDVGLREEKPRTLDFKEDDSSIDGDSSGNESLTADDVRKRYRVVKRRNRDPEEHTEKLRKKLARMEEVAQEIENQPKDKEDTGMDHIIMEYLPHGNLATLIFKIRSLESERKSFVNIPNRVLWAFWLCLVRGCIAMEYPPRKFHPLRKEPKLPENAVTYAAARASRMLRECRRLGIMIFRPEEYERSKAEYQQLEGDLIENIPNPSGRRADNWKRARRQNMVHRDLDPTNIFINGLELDHPAPKHWPEEETDTGKGKERENPSDQNEKAPENKTLSSTGRRPADFGIAVCVKPEKTNLYYYNLRYTGKHGYHPPETFCPEWERTRFDDSGGDDLANSRTAGYYSNKTNIWHIGMTMWEVITGYSAPTPPLPQPPPGFTPVPGNEGAQNAALNDFMEDTANLGTKISYCPLLLDEDRNNYEWVDKTLRQTIYQCMYHRPDDRPSLEELLREAEENSQADFEGETDDRIRDWIQHLFFDADVRLPGREPAPAPAPPGPPAPHPVVNLDDPYGFRASEIGNPAKFKVWGAYLRTFIDGFELIPNPGTGLQCGLTAIVDSLRAQIDPSRKITIHGVEYTIASFPTEADLRAIYGDLKDQGLFDGILPDDEIGEAGNFGISQLSAIFAEWTRRRGVSDLELAYMQRGRGAMAEPGPSDDPMYIWIHNDNAQEIAEAEAARDGGDVPPELLNHWEGMRPKPRPDNIRPPEDPDAPDGEHGSDFWLEDYQSDSNSPDGPGGSGGSGGSGNGSGGSGNGSGGSGNGSGGSGNGSGGSGNGSSG